MLTADVASVTCQGEPEVSPEKDEGISLRPGDVPGVQLMSVKDGPD